MSLVSIVFEARRLAYLGKTAHEIAVKLDCHMITAIEAQIWAARTGLNEQLAFLRIATQNGDAVPAAAAGVAAGTAVQQGAGAHE